MRRQDLETTAHHWLAAEAAGDELAAERRLARLLAGFPSPIAPPWLTAAVMTGLPRVRRWTLERMAALLFVACGVGVVFSGWWFPLLVDGVALGARWVASFSLAGWLAAGVEDLASLWTVWSELGRFGLLIGASPGGLAILAVCSLLTFGAAFLLRRLLGERSSAHAR
jgi:hypothetical protein